MRGQRDVRASGNAGMAIWLYFLAGWVETTKREEGENMNVLLPLWVVSFLLLPVPRLIAQSVPDMGVEPWWVKTLGSGSAQAILSVVCLGLTITVAWLGRKLVQSWEQRIVDSQGVLQKAIDALDALDELKR